MTLDRMLVWLSISIILLFLSVGTAAVAMMT